MRRSGFVGKLNNQKRFWDAIGFQSHSGYEQRYASNWSSTSKKCKLLTGGYCCFPGCWRRDGLETHHTVYRDVHGPIFGRELPGVHIFPTCSYHHSSADRNCCHHKSSWNGGILPPPRLDACNTPAYWQLLRKGWLEKRAFVKRKLGK